MPIKPIIIKHPLTLTGDIQGLSDLSGMALTGPYLLLGTDEGVGSDNNINRIQILKQVDLTHYHYQQHIDLFSGDKEDGLEMDIEGLVFEAGTLYVTGSHTLRRPPLKADKNLAQNRKRLRSKAIDAQRNRDWLYRLQLNDDLSVRHKERISLRKIINKNPVLKPFSRIPGKENGVDIEGIAVDGDWLYLGLRGPVLRGNYVPVLKLKFDAPKKSHELLFVQLSGRGCREIKRVSDGFLLIAGPVGDGNYPYQLYHWNGLDMVPGQDRAEKECGEIRLLGDFPATTGKPEGLAIQKEGEDYYDILVIYDGITAPHVARGHCLRITKPVEPVGD